MKCGQRSKRCKQGSSFAAHPSFRPVAGIHARAAAVLSPSLLVEHRATRTSDMLQGLPSSKQLSTRGFQRRGLQCVTLRTPYHLVKGTRRFASCRTSRARSKYCSGPPRCSFASAVNSSLSAQSVTTQSVTEAVAKATLDRPLFQHALHSIFSSLAWFGLAWIITRYIRKLAKEHEAPEVGVSEKPTGFQQALCLLAECNFDLQEPAPAFLSELSPSSVPRVKRPVYVHVGQAVLVALHLPIAVFLPLAAIVYSLRSIAWFLGVALASETRRQSFSEPLGMSMHSIRALRLVPAAATL